ncbi:hypothetical protein ACXZ66_04345 [Corynebacterium sp. S7]
MIGVPRLRCPIPATAPPHEVLTCNVMGPINPTLPGKRAQMSYAGVDGGGRAALRSEEEFEVE